MYVLRELQLELAGLCNIACTYCTWRDRPTGKQLMDAGLAYRLLREAAQMDPFPLVTLHGVGEATLHPELPTLLEEANLRAMPIRLSTNCTTLETPLIARLRPLNMLGLSLALHQGLPQKTREKCTAHALDFLAAKPLCRMVEIIVVCDGQGAPAAERIVETFLPLVERNPNARINLKQPQTWPRSDPIKGHIPGGAWEKHPQVFVDRVQTPRSLGKDCTMPEYLFNVQADGTTTLCCVGQEDWGLPNIEGRSLADLWNGPAVEESRRRWRDKSDSLPCGHCRKRTDCV